MSSFGNFNLSLPDFLSLDVLDETKESCEGYVDLDIVPSMFDQEMEIPQPKIKLPTPSTTDTKTISEHVQSLPGRDDFQNFINDQENKNTLKKTLSDIKKLDKFMSEKGEKRPLHKIPMEELDQHIASFIMTVKKPDGEDYEPTSIRNMISSFDRKLGRQGYQYRIISTTTNAFHLTRETLKAKLKLLKKRGKGNRPKEAEALSDDDINVLYERKQLGKLTPVSLINTLWLNNCLHFGMRGITEHYRLRGPLMERIYCFEHPMKRCITMRTWQTSLFLIINIWMMTSMVDGTADDFDSSNASRHQLIGRCYEKAFMDPLEVQHVKATEYNGSCDSIWISGRDTFHDYWYNWQRTPTNVTSFTFWIIFTVVSTVTTSSSFVILLAYSCLLHKVDEAYKQSSRKKKYRENIIKYQDKRDLKKCVSNVSSASKIINESQEMMERCCLDVCYKDGSERSNKCEVVSGHESSWLTVNTGQTDRGNLPIRVLGDGYISLTTRKRSPQKSSEWIKKFLCPHSLKLEQNVFERDQSKEIAQICGNNGLLLKQNLSNQSKEDDILDEKCKSRVTDVYELVDSLDIEEETSVKTPVNVVKHNEEKCFLDSEIPSYVTGPILQPTIYNEDGILTTVDDCLFTLDCSEVQTMPAASELDETFVENVINEKKPQKQRDDDVKPTHQINYLVKELNKDASNKMDARCINLESNMTRFNEKLLCQQSTIVGKKKEGSAVYGIKKEGSAVFAKRNGSAMFAKRNGSAVFAKRNGSAMYAHKNGSAVYAKRNGSAVYALKNGSAVYALRNGSAVYAQRNGSAVYALRNGSAVYAKRNGSAVYAQRNGSAVYAKRNGSAVYAQRNGSAVFAKRNGSAVYAKRNGSAVYALRNGSAVFAKRNGSAVYALRNGSAVFAKRNGSAVFAKRNGSGVYALRNGSAVYAKRNGSAVYALRNGSAVYAKRNGSGVYAKRNGSAVYAQRNGSAVYAQRNGSAVYAKRNGSAVYAQRNGSGVYAKRNGSGVYALKNGSAVYALRNGSAVYAQRNGSAVYALRNGSGVYALRNGSAVYAQRNGSAVYALRNGSGVYAKRNGSAVYAQRNGSAVYAKRNGSAVFAKRYGSAVYAQRNGSAVYAKRNGSAVYALRNGSAVSARRKGAAVYANRKGAAMYAQRNGSAMYAQRNGSAVYAKRNGSAVYALRNGSAVYAKRNGSAVYALRNGSAVFAKRKGAAVYTNRKGAAMYAQMNGSAMYAQRNGSAVYAKMNGSAVYAKRNCAAVYAKQKSSAVYAKRKGAAVYAKRKGAAVYAKQNGSAVYAMRKGAAVYVKRKDSAVYAKRNGSAVYAFRNGSTVYAKRKGAAVYAKQKGEATHAQRNGSAVYAKRNGSDVYAKRKGAAVYAKQKSSAVYAKRKGAAVYVKRKGAAVYAKRNGSAVYAKRKGAAVYAKRKGAAVYAKRKGSSVYGQRKGSSMYKRSKDSSLYGQWKGSSIFGKSKGSIYERSKGSSMNGQRKGPSIFGKSKGFMYERSKGSSMYGLRKGSAVYAKRNGSAVYAKRNGSAVYAKRKGAAVYAKQKRSAVYSKRKGAAVFVKRKGAAVYANMNGTTLYAKRNGSAMYAKRKGSSVYGHRNGSAVYGQRNGSAVYGQRNGSAVYEKRNEGSSVYGQRKGLSMFGQRKGLSMFEQRKGLSMYGQRKGLSMFAKRKGLVMFGKRNGSSMYRKIKSHIEKRACKRYHRKLLQKCPVCRVCIPMSSSPEKDDRMLFHQNNRHDKAISLKSSFSSICSSMDSVISLTSDLNDPEINLNEAMMNNSKRMQHEEKVLYKENKLFKSSYDSEGELMQILRRDNFQPHQLQWVVAVSVVAVPPALPDYSQRVMDQGQTSPEEWIRLSSFSSYSGAGSNVRLAEHGFYHDTEHGPRATRCYACQLLYTEWEFFDNIEDKHRRLSPNCPLINNNAPPTQNLSVVSGLENGTPPATAAVPEVAGSSVGEGHSQITGTTITNTQDRTTNRDMVREGFPVQPADGPFDSGHVFVLGQSRPEEPGYSDMGPNTNNTTTEASTDESDTLKEENEKLRKRQTCKICMDKLVNMTLLPCGHLVCCEVCAPQLRKCPICRKQIQGLVKTLMS